MVPHHGTLLDGEMVVDEDMVSGLKTRRFLVYDMMANRCNGIIDRKFQERFKMIEDEVLHRPLPCCCHPIKLAAGWAAVRAHVSHL